MANNKRYGTSILILMCVLHCTLAWKSPARCQKLSRSARHASTSTSTLPLLDRKLDNLAADRNQFLNHTYRNYEFVGMPYGIRKLAPLKYEIKAPLNCEFHTFNPSFIASVECDATVSCKLEETVETVETYTPSEGRNWGAVARAKTSSSIPNVFEIGGDTSSDVNYSCTHTKSRNLKKNVECTTTGPGTLQLYAVKSDVECQFGKFIVEAEDRPGLEQNNQTPENFFSLEETNDINFSVTAALVEKSDYYVMVDVDSIYMSDRLLQKVKTIAPGFNPYTDIIHIHYAQNGPIVRVYYLKATSFEETSRKVIPFTTPEGNSAFEFACIKV